MSQEKREPNYVIFSRRLWQLRKSSGMSTDQVAKFLGLEGHEYRAFERGEILPDKKNMLGLARLYKTDLAKLKSWELHAKRKNFHNIDLEGAMAYGSLLDLAIERAKIRSQEYSGGGITREQLSIFGNLKGELYKTFTLPLLPFNTLLILTALLEERQEKVKYIHEISDFVAPNESLAGFVSRDPILGPFMFYIANLIYFTKNPSLSITDCFNRLSLAQFEELFYMALVEKGIYTLVDEIKILQQQLEFGALGVLLAQELKEHLPKTVKYEHLYMAILLQNIGMHALYTILQPSLKGERERDINSTESAGSDPDPYLRLTQQMFDAINYEMHPIVSTMIAADWDFPREVLEVLQTHHDKPFEKVEPLCATLKLINFFIDLDFPELSEEDIIKLMKQYPQISIPVEVLVQASVKIKKVKEKLIERSSMIMENKSELVQKYVDLKLENMLNDSGSVRKFPPKRSQLMFDIGYIKASVHSCLTLIDEFKNKINMPREGESLAKFQERVGLIYLRIAYAKKRDFQALSQTFDVKVEDLKSLLNLK